MQPVINELIKFAIRQSPHRRIKIESAWEKQHLAWEKKHLSKQDQMDVAERKMQLGECEIPTLRGWFLKVRSSSDDIFTLDLGFTAQLFDTRVLCQFKGKTGDIQKASDLSA